MDIGGPPIAVYRELDAPLEIPANKKAAFEAVAAYYGCEARLGSKIVSYGNKKTDVGISYLSAVRLCSEKLASLAAWPPAIVELFVEFLGAVKRPMKKDDWTMTCFLTQYMEEEGYEEITRDDVIDFLSTDEEEEGNFRTLHYEWLRYLRTGEAVLYMYYDVEEWVPSADPAHPKFAPIEDADPGLGPGVIVGAQVEEKGENPFLSRESSTYLPSGTVRVLFPESKDSDIEMRDRQRHDVVQHAQLVEKGDVEGARKLKKDVMQRRINLSHRYSTILVEYEAKKGMYAGGVFHFLFRTPPDYPIRAPLCHCLTPIWHPNILHDPEAAPREQNVCCSYLHDNTFVDSSEQGYEPGMSLWKVVWGVCLLLHRGDTEGLGVFTLSNPLNAEAAGQFLRDEAGFVEKAREYTAQYATLDYFFGLQRWHEFYPRDIKAMYASPSAHGHDSAWGSGPSDARPALMPIIEHPSLPEGDAQCSVFFEPIDNTNYVEYRVAPSGKWYAAPVCDSVIMNVLCGEHNQFAEWLKLIESVGNDLSACATLKARLFDDTATESPAKGPPMFVESSSMLPVPDDATHVDMLFFSGGAPELPALATSDDVVQVATGGLRPEPEPEPELDELHEFHGDGQHMSARLFGSVDGAIHDELWSLHIQVYHFNKPEEECTELSPRGPIPVIPLMVGAGVTRAVADHLQRLRNMYDPLRS